MQIIQEISEIKDIHNWFIVDMGYSNRSKSCGVLMVRNNKYTDENLEDIAFGKLEKKFSDYCKECKNEKIGLILEAPLSIAFDKKKNPLGRKKFEKEDHVTRYWYYGAGATVTLGALEFINRIKDISADNTYLFEGFVSFKNEEDPNQESKSKKYHYEDAELLYAGVEHFKKSPECGKIITQNAGEKYMFIGDYLNLVMNGIPPVIKITTEKAKEIYMIKS